MPKTMSIEKKYPSDFTFMVSEGLYYRTSIKMSSRKVREI